MADTHLIVEYSPLVRHRQEIAEQRRQRRNRLVIAIPSFAGLVWLVSIFSLPLAMLLAVVGSFFLFFLALPGASSVDSGALAGVEGEMAVLKKLATLPDDFLLLNRIYLPDETLPNGQRELDFIVAGPSGLWVIEVKNTPGHIRVVPDEKQWPMARRAGCGSSPSWNAIKNPLPQARAQVELLKRWFLTQGIAVEPKAAVVMAHPETLLIDADRSPIPVLVRDQVCGILRHADSAPVASSTLARLQRLRNQRLSEPALAKPAQAAAGVDVKHA